MGVLVITQLVMLAECSGSSPTSYTYVSSDTVSITLQTQLASEPCTRAGGEKGEIGKGG